MPNITLYLTDEEYVEFKSLSDEQQKEGRDNATKQILRLIKVNKKEAENGV